MPHGEHHRIPKVMSGVLYTDHAATGIRVDTPAWFDWLADRRRAGVLRRVYLGKEENPMVFAA
jgi:hypothetical protein